MHRTDQVFIYFNFPWLFGAFPLSPEYEGVREPEPVGEAAIVPYLDDLALFYDERLEIWVSAYWPSLFDFDF